MIINQNLKLNIKMCHSGLDPESSDVKLIMPRAYSTKCSLDPEINSG